MNREPAPKMTSIYRNPNAQEDIAKKILDYELGKPDEKPLEEMNGYEQTIAKYSKDYVIRKGARKIQMERMKQQKDFSDQMEKEAAEELKNSPVIITIGDMMDYLEEKKAELEESNRKDKEKYQAMRKEILDEKYIGPAALRLMTNNAYNQQYKAWKAAEELYKQEAAKDQDMYQRRAILGDDMYNRYPTNLRHAKTDMEQKRQQFQQTQYNCAGNHPNRFLMLSAAFLCNACHCSCLAAHHLLRFFECKLIHFQSSLSIVRSLLLRSV